MFLRFKFYYSLYLFFNIRSILSLLIIFLYLLVVLHSVSYKYLFYYNVSTKYSSVIIDSFWFRLKNTIDSAGFSLLRVKLQGAVIIILHVDATGWELYKIFLFFDAYRRRFLRTNLYGYVGNGTANKITIIVKLYNLILNSCF